jgi:F-type H+-transporting ATPase subunit a
VGCTKQIRVALCLVFFTFLSSAIPLFAQHHTQGHETGSAVQSTEDHTATEAVHGDASHEESFNAAEVILEHVKDAHEWHILTTKKGRHVSVPLPVILYSKHSGLHAFMSSKLSHGHNYKGFEIGHGTRLMEKEPGVEIEKNIEGKVIEVDADGALVEAGLPLDFSITKNVFMMFLAVAILLVVFLGLARSYKKVGVSEPKGMQGFLEPLIVFVEEDIAQPNISGEKYQKFMPYLLTVFFFILIHNLMGLIPFFPFGANVTGNIAVTLVLATFTLLLTNLNANKAYWRHIFLPPGVPRWLLPIMIPVELLGIITKPFALMIRLFANITAGHIIVLSLVSLIFIFKSVFMSVPSLVMVIFMDMIEILVAFLQAYIFTLLSALFIGLAVPEHHHE